MRIITLVLLGVITFPLVALGHERWVAVGYGGRRMLSTDGLKWEVTAEWSQPGGDDGHNLMSAAYGSGKFVAVGGGGGGPYAAGHILVSADGRDWKGALTAKARIHPVVFGKDRFVVGTSSYPSGRLMWSPDGEVWKDGAAIKAKGYTHFRGGAYGNETFVLVGNGGEKGKTSWAIATPDGERITSEADDLPGHGTIVFGGGTFAMLTSHSNADIITSTDGARWETVKLKDSAKVNWLVWTGKELLAGDGKSAYGSVDGVEWSRRDMRSRGEVKWSDATQFISTSWPGKMSYSADGNKWEDCPPLSPNGINAVVYAADE